MQEPVFVAAALQRSLLCIFHFGGGFVSLQRNEWRKFQAPKGVVTPKGRRSHTATVFQDSLYIYGGYQDLKGSTSELWAFHFGKYCCDCVTNAHT